MSLQAYFKKFGLKLVFLALFIFLLLSNVEIGINVSQSLPGKVFLTIKRLPPVRDGYVEYYFDKDFGQFKVGDRFVKIVKGLPGDTVLEKGGNIYINEVFISKASDRFPGISSQVLKSTQLYVHGVHENSFDSRYLPHGLVSISKVVGRSFVVF